MLVSLFPLKVCLGVHPIAEGVSLCCLTNATMLKCLRQLFAKEVC